MRCKRLFSKLIAMTMAAVMLPWSSFVYGENVNASSFDIDYSKPKSSYIQTDKNIPDITDATSTDADIVITDT